MPLKTPLRQVGVPFGYRIHLCQKKWTTVVVRGLLLSERT